MAWIKCVVKELRYSALTRDLASNNVLVYPKAPSRRRKKKVKTCALKNILVYLESPRRWREKAKSRTLKCIIFERT